jgi:serine/threonine protein phosphatase PrpC
MLRDQELATILSEHFRSTEAAEKQCAKALSAMLETANEAGGRDNITAALIRFG